MKKITEEWITQAEKDYLVAIRELKTTPIVGDAVCFHAQPCVGKYMKEILQENEIEFEKIHDLDVLLNY
jgi:HEPN domain-containing protein